MQTGEIADHPFAVMRFPVKRRPPVFAIYNFPALGKPPAEILVTTVANELQVIAICHQRAIECVVRHKNLVRRLLIVECKVVITRAFDLGLWTLDFGPVTEPKQSALDLRHPYNLYARFGSNTDGRVKLIAQEMFDVVNQQLLMLHLVLESESHKTPKLVSLVID